MQWLLVGTVPKPAADALVARGDKVHGVEELNLPAGHDGGTILAAAAARNWDVFTADPVLAAMPFQRRVRFPRCIVHLQLTAEAEADESSAAVERLFARFKRLNSGMLYAVNSKRAKARQLPTVSARPMETRKITPMQPAPLVAPAES